MLQGWEELLELLERQRDRGEPLPEIAGFGSGEAGDSVSSAAEGVGSWAPLRLAPLQLAANSILFLCTDTAALGSMLAARSCEVVDSLPIRHIQCYSWLPVQGACCSAGSAVERGWSGGYSCLPAGVFQSFPFQRCKGALSMHTDGSCIVLPADSEARK